MKCNKYKDEPKNQTIPFTDLIDKKIVKATVDTDGKETKFTLYLDNKTQIELFENKGVEVSWAIFGPE